MTKGLPIELTAKLRALGRVIAPLETATLYAPLHTAASPEGVKVMKRKWMSTSEQFTASQVHPTDGIEIIRPDTVLWPAAPLLAWALPCAPNGRVQ